MYLKGQYQITSDLKCLQKLLFTVKIKFSLFPSLEKLIWSSLHLPLPLHLISLQEPSRWQWALLVISLSSLSANLGIACRSHHSSLVLAHSWCTKSITHVPIHHDIVTTQHLLLLTLENCHHQRKSSCLTSFQ